MLQFICIWFGRIEQKFIKHIFGTNGEIALIETFKQQCKMQFIIPILHTVEIVPVREKVGLGHPPKEYHNNSSECINNVIKMKVKRERNALDDFYCKMMSLVKISKIIW